MSADWPQPFVNNDLNLLRSITEEQVRNSPKTLPSGPLSGVPLLDPTALTMRDMPPEWDAVPTEILAQLAPQAFREVVRPDGRSYIADVTGVITALQKKAIDTIARGRWFVMRNIGPAGKAICGRCGRRHDYLTLGCVERPFHGLQEIVGLMETYEADGNSAERILTAIRLGSIVPITRKQARQLSEKIRAKGISL